MDENEPRENEPLGLGPCVEDHISPLTPVVDQYPHENEEAGE